MFLIKTCSTCLDLLLMPGGVNSPIISNLSSKQCERIKVRSPLFSQGTNNNDCSIILELSFYGKLAVISELSWPVHCHFNLLIMWTMLCVVAGYVESCARSAMKNSIKEPSSQKHISPEIKIIICEWSYVLKSQFKTNCLSAYISKLSQHKYFHKVC